MSKEKQNLPNAPTAPAVGYDTMNNNYAQRAPPPSYEDSMKHSAAYNSAAYFATQATAAAQSQMPYGVYGMQQQQQQHQQQQQQQQQQPMAMLPGYAPPPCYQTHMQQQQQLQQQYYYYQSNAMASGSGSVGHNTKPQVLTFAKGAEIRTTMSGAVTVPPPPPGCAPTPAQMAAMQGQSVVVKQQNRSFW